MAAATPCTIDNQSLNSAQECLIVLKCLHPDKSENNGHFRHTDGDQARVTVAHERRVFGLCVVKSSRRRRRSKSVTSVQCIYVHRVEVQLWEKVFGHPKNCTQSQFLSENLCVFRRFGSTQANGKYVVHYLIRQNNNLIRLLLVSQCTLLLWTSSC